MKKVLIGSTNASKIQYFKTLLQDYEVEWITLNDIKISSIPKETGKTEKENAILKASFYGQFCDAVLCNDSGLYFADLSLTDPRQPGLHIRSPQGIELNDEEMITYYSSLIASFQKDMKAYYKDSFAVFYKGKISSFSSSKRIASYQSFYLTKIPQSFRHKGWPLDSLVKENIRKEKNNPSLLAKKERTLIEYQTRLIHFFATTLHLKPKRIIETERLYLRKLVLSDLKTLKAILQDKEVMVAYEHAFSNQEVLDWFYKNRLRYQKDGFGLWAVVLKETDEMIGQCGITYQAYKDKQLIEIGYLFLKSFWHQGFATEAAIACKNYAFQILNAKEVYSIIRDNNVPSICIAKRNGMKKIDQIIKHYYSLDLVHDVYRIQNQS